MIGLITFDTETYTLDAARMSTAAIAIILLRLMFKLFKQRKYIKGSYYSPILLFTCFWLTVMLATSLIPLLINMDVISDGPLFAAIAASYIWSLAGTGWILSNYAKHYAEIITSVREATKELLLREKAE
jgi:hypothetical protein